MDFDKVFYDSIRKKFPLEENDRDFGSDGGWIDYYIKENVPSTYVEDGEEYENLTSITVDVFDVDPSWEYEDGSFYEDFGNGMERCDSGSGYVLDGLSCDTDTRFFNDGDEITIEKFAKINGISMDEVKVLVEVAKKYASGDYESWAEDNLEYND